MQLRAYATFTFPGEAGRRSSLLFPVGVIAKAAMF